MNRRGFLAVAALGFAPGRARANEPLHALRFSSLRPGTPLPADYRPYVFSAQSRHTEYSLVADEAGGTVLRARADASTAGIIRDLRVDLDTHPVLAWRWKAVRLPQKADLRAKAGDDFAARLYVVFDLRLAALPFGERFGVTMARLIYGEDVPAAALCYVWATRAAVGTVAPNAYTGRVRMVVVDSGPANLGRWVAHERDVAGDYRLAFGEAPPAVKGVVVSTDSDNTGERAEAWYGDAAFRSRPRP